MDSQCVHLHDYGVSTFFRIPELAEKLGMTQGELVAWFAGRGVDIQPDAEVTRSELTQEIAREIVGLLSGTDDPQLAMARNTLDELYAKNENSNGQSFVPLPDSESA